MAFPLISAGVYGYPKAEAIAVAVDIITKYAGDISTYLVLFDSEAATIARSAYPELW